ncbi:MAG: hypothetical protein ACOYO1_09080 [Bacteroidales bacterium]
MKNLNRFFTLLVLFSIVMMTNCKKDDSSTTTATASKAFVNLTFNKVNAFFSTNGSMSAPVDSTQAKAISSKIDITFIFNYDYTKPGFFDPKARAQQWYWDDYYAPWLNNAVETRYYSTSLTKAQFDAAKADQTKIATYFANTSVRLCHHGIFPNGSCIGGRQTQNDTASSVLLAMDVVFGFKNTASGKRGLLYIRTDQSYAWPTPLIDFNTKVDIIREN